MINQILGYLLNNIRASCYLICAVIKEQILFYLGLYQKQIRRKTE